MILSRWYFCLENNNQIGGEYKVQFSFNSFDGYIENYTIIVQLDDTIVRQFELPQFVARGQFEQLVYQTAKDNRPFKVTCVKKECTEEGKELNNSLSFENNAFIEAFKNRA
jgi:hypothetical protein